MPLSSPVLTSHLELPETLPKQTEFHVQGWVASMVPIDGITIKGGKPLQMLAREDVAAAMPQYPHSCGFAGLVRKSDLVDGSLDVLVELRSGSTVTQTFPFDGPSEAWLKTKAERLSRVYPLLRCPKCHGRFSDGGFHREVETIECSSCNARFDCGEGYFDLMSPEARQDLSPIDATGIGMNEYDDRARALIEDNRGGLVLDCGAGYRRVEYPHVINVEVAPYPSTDVLAQSEALPFRDNSFDAALSLAVLEHVKDPFRSAREMYRVVKPGGTLLCVAPFLVPVHAFPSHYYNMTSEGLRNLFPPELEVIDRDVLNSGLPIFWLTWALRTWSDALRGETREAFLDLRVRDFLSGPYPHLSRAYVSKLPKSVNFELAATTLLIGRKPR